MSPPALRPESICQVGLVVNDIEASARRYAQLFGLEARRVETPGYARAKTIVSGEPSEATAKLAFFQMGQLTIELIQPDDKPSIWRDHLDKYGEGVHHIAFSVDDTKRVENAFAEFGVKAGQQGLYADASGMYTYLDSGPHLGVMIELLETFAKRDAG